MRRFAVGFALVVGAGMLGMWAMSLLAGDVPEVRTEPIRLGFHLAAEGLTALTLIVSAVGLARGVAWAQAAYRVAVGMLLYTVVVSPGYFAQRGQWGLVVMFAAFCAGALLALRAVSSPQTS